MRRIISIALLLLTSACIVPPPNPPVVAPMQPPVLTPAAVGENLTVVGPSGQVEGAHAVLAGDDGAVYEATTDAGGRAGLVVQSTGGSTLTVTADGYQPSVLRLLFCASTCELEPVTLIPALPSHPFGGETGPLIQR